MSVEARKCCGYSGLGPCGCEVYPPAERFLDMQPIDEHPHVFDGKWRYYRSDSVVKLLIAFASHTRREALNQLVDDLEDCGSLACTLLDIPLERVQFGPEGMRMDCETAKTLAGAAIARIRNWAAIRLLAEEKK